MSSAFEVVAEPSRRRILELLRDGERPVNDLVDERFDLLLAVCALGGCGKRPEAAVTPVEQKLIDGLTRDQFVRVESITREEDGWLSIRTGQGSTTVYYRLMPAADGQTELVARRVDEAQELPVVWTVGIGTGPEPRGLAR